jgi:uncharacterized protein YbbK (DUF523 family)
MSIPRIGISSCLLGEAVRYDGGHKLDAILTGLLAPHVEWVPVCPEVEVGMGTPRETLRLVRDQAGRVRMVTTRSGVDHTGGMTSWARRRVRELSGERLSGYILKKNSPSCGLNNVPVTGATGSSEEGGRGLFAAELVAQFPDLPVEEESRLADPRIREDFLQRVFAYQRRHYT